MLKRHAPALTALILLILASLACSTVMGGSANSAEATVEAAQTQAEATFESAEATAGAVFDPNDNENDNGNDNSGDDDNDNSNADNNNDNDDPSGGDYQFADEGPDNLPLFVLDGDLEAQIVFADASNLTYSTDGEFDDVLAFYRDAMPDLGWELSANGDNVFGQLATLQYEQGSDVAIIAITPDVTGAGNVLVTVTIQ